MNNTIRLLLDKLPDAQPDDTTLDLDARPMARRLHALLSFTPAIDALLPVSSTVHAVQPDQ